MAAIDFAPEERFLECVHCGLCLDACPTYVESGLEADSPRGRLYLMHALRKGTLSLDPGTVRHLDGCLGCRACETACPSGVSYGALIEAARPAIETHHRRPWPERLRRGLIARMLADPRGQRVLVAAARLLPRRTLAAVARNPRLPSLVRFRAALAAALPHPDPTPLPATVEPPIAVEPPSGVEPRAALGSRPTIESGGTVEPGTGGEPARDTRTTAARVTVALFPGCIGQTLFGGTNARAVGLLARAGFRVVVPPEPLCCGALLVHLGRVAPARALARRTVEVLGRLGADTIAVTAAGCGAMLQSYGELLGTEGHEIATRTRDVLALLADAPLAPPSRPLRLLATYHDACHLAHAQGVRAAPRALLQRIPGLELIELEEADRCCGSAGPYNLTQPRIALRVLERKIDRIRATGAALVAAANPGCILQIRAGLIAAGSRIQVAHPVDVLAAAYEISQPLSATDRGRPASG